MQDQWTPLFSELRERVSLSGRKRLLYQLISEIQNIAQANFGETGVARPIEWPNLKNKYAINFHDGDQTPTLILSGEMINGFVRQIGTDSATLTNVAEYASEQQEGNPSKKLPARPYFPVAANGDLTPYAIERLQEILDLHFGVEP